LKKRKTIAIHGCGGYGVKCHFQQYFSFIMADIFIGAGNQSTFFLYPEKTSCNNVAPVTKSCLECTLVSCTNKNVGHDKTEKLLKMAFNTITSTSRIYLVPLGHMTC
jgi:hypothetical protein